jgi:hypothetical protein
LRRVRVSVADRADLHPALNLYHDRPGALSDDQVAGTRRSPFCKPLGHEVASRRCARGRRRQLEQARTTVSVHQATGRISVQVGISLDDALVLCVRTPFRTTVSSARSRPRSRPGGSTSNESFATVSTLRAGRGQMSRARPARCVRRFADICRRVRRRGFFIDLRLAVSNSLTQPGGDHARRVGRHSRMRVSSERMRLIELFELNTRAVLGRIPHGRRGTATRQAVPCAMATLCAARPKSVFDQCRRCRCTSRRRDQRPESLLYRRRTARHN